MRVLECPILHVIGPSEVSVSGRLYPVSKSINSNFLVVDTYCLLTSGLTSWLLIGACQLAIMVLDGLDVKLRLAFDSGLLFLVPMLLAKDVPTACIFATARAFIGLFPFAVFLPACFIIQFSMMIAVLCCCKCIAATSTALAYYMGFCPLLVVGHVRLSMASAHRQFTLSWIGTGSPYA